MFRMSILSEIKKNYNDVPAYSVSEMDGNMELEFFGDVIEGALCSYDIKVGNKLKDNDAIRIIELLIDRYHFKDQQIDTDSQIVTEGVNHVQKAVKKNLQEINNENIVKLFGVIRFVAKRRTKVGREYMDIIQKYVGPTDMGIRMLRW